MNISLEQKYMIENFKNIVLLEDLKILLNIIEKNQEKIELNNFEIGLIEIVNNIVNLENKKGE